MTSSFTTEWEWECASTPKGKLITLNPAPLQETKREGTSPFSFLMLASLSILGNCSRRLTAPSGDWLSALAMPQQVLGGREHRPSVPSVPWQAASPSQTRRHSPPGGSQPFSWHSHSSESSGSACAHMNAVA